MAQGENDLKVKEITQQLVKLRAARQDLVNKHSFLGNNKDIKEIDQQIAAARKALLTRLNIDPGASANEKDKPSRSCASFGCAIL